MVVRQTRCVTVYYADAMHLDITPSLRDRWTPERQSVIMHARGPKATADDCQVPMNAYGFCQWYIERTPIEQKVLDALMRRWELNEGRRAKADADADDVPIQMEFVVKSNTTLALQLIKRFRNIRYANRTGRMPPSVMLSYYAGMAARPGSSLTDALLRICKWIIGEIDQATFLRQKIHAVNPVYGHDVFTDRWPATLQDQTVFAQDLRELVAGIERAMRGDMLPNALQDWLREFFGDRVVTRAVDQMAAATAAAAASASQSYTRRGGILVATAAGIGSLASVSKVAASQHTYFGDCEDE